MDSEPEHQEESKKLTSLSKWFVGILLIIMLLQLLFSFNKDFFWGFSHYNNHASFLVYWGISLAAILFIAVPKVNSAIWRMIHFIRAKIKDKYSLIFYLFISLVFGIVFFLFKVMARMGDNWIRHGIRAATLVCMECPHKGLMMRFFPSSPLGAFLNSTLIKIYLLLGGNTPKNIVIGGSIFLGILFVFSLLYFTKKAFTDYHKRFVFFSITVSSGFMLLFFGYKEVMQYAMPFLLLYFLTSYFVLNKKGSLFWPTLFFCIAFWIHLSVAWFGPSLIYLYLSKIKLKLKPFSLKISKKIITGILLGFLVPSVLFIVYAEYSVSRHSFHITDLGLGDLEGGGDKSKWVPLRKVELPSQKYLLFSIGHLFEILSEHFLLANIAFIAFALIFIKYCRQMVKDKFLVFLFIAFLFFQIYAAVWNQDLTPRIKDWDLFSFLGIPITLLSAYALTRFTSKKELRYIGLIAVVAGIIFTMPWIYINSDFGSPINNLRAGEIAGLFYETSLFVSPVNNMLRPIDITNIQKGTPVFLLLGGVGRFEKGPDNLYKANVDLTLTNLDNNNITIHKRIFQGGSISDLPFGIIKVFPIDIKTPSLDKGRYNVSVTVYDELSGRNMNFALTARTLNIL